MSGLLLSSAVTDTPRAGRGSRRARVSESGIGNNQLVAPLTDQVDRYLAADYQRTGCDTPVPAAQVMAWTTQFNKILTSGIAGLPGVYYLDAGNVLAQVALHPSQYGITNVTDPACTDTTPTTAAVFCNGATLAEPDAANTYLWADTFHPTPRGHQILADETLKLLVPHTG